MNKPSAEQVARVSTLLAIMHSALASRAAKDAVGRLFGQWYRNGLYHISFVVQSLVAVFLPPRTTSDQTDTG